MEEKALADDEWVTFYRENAALIGSVTIEWNAAHGALLELYILNTSWDTEMAKAVFFNQRTDSSQRDLAATVCFFGLRPYPDLQNRCKALCDKFNKLASERNAAIHTIWATQFSDDGRLVPEQSILEYHHGSLKKDDIVKQFMDLARQLIGMSTEFWTLCSELLERKIQRQEFLLPSLGQSANKLAGGLLGNYEDTSPLSPPSPE